MGEACSKTKSIKKLQNQPPSRAVDDRNLLVLVVVAVAATPPVRCTKGVFRITCGMGTGCCAAGS